VSALPNIKPTVKEKGNYPTAFDTRMKNPSINAESSSPVAKTQQRHLDRRQTINPTMSQRAEFSSFAERQMTADAMLARHLSLDGSHSRAQKQPSRLSSPYPTFPSRAQKLRSTLVKPLTSPILNNPWKNYIEADQAFAHYLQLQEEQELQTERDMLLAYKIANGTADEGDKELAYFMHQESVKLIESTPVLVLLTQSGSDTWGMDPDTLRAQISWFEAHQLDKELNSQSSVDEESFAEAERLQEQFDQEVKDEEAWEAWKGSNVGTCSSCMEEHAREELVKECEHGYCNGCLQDGFKAALESRSPFKCCKKVLPIKECLGLEDEFVTEYEELVLELSTPDCPISQSVSHQLNLISQLTD
jgi:hypothetical protein